jgi:hypothetical protein
MANRESPMIHLFKTREYECCPVGGTRVLVPFSMRNGIMKINVGRFLGLDCYKTSSCLIEDVIITCLITVSAAHGELIHILDLEEFQNAYHAVGS